MCSAPLTSERQQSEGEEQHQGHQSHGGVQERGCFSLRSVLKEVPSLKRSAEMRHGQGRLLEWVGEHRGVSGMCLLLCSLSLSLSDQSISLNAFIMQVGSEFPPIAKKMRHDQETSLSLRHVRAGEGGTRDTALSIF